MARLSFLSVFFLTFSLFATPPSLRGLSENPDSINSALLVSSAHGLPGLEYDIANVDKMASSTGSGFTVDKLTDGQGTAQNILDNLTQLSNAVDSRGTLLFYFTGHGGSKIMLADDRVFTIDEVRQAMLKGREAWGPLVRLTFLIDACHSGSLIDPLHLFDSFSRLESPRLEAMEMAQSVVDGLAPHRDEPVLYSSLFAFVSARADETCNAGDQGSDFTVAMRGAWNAALKDPSMTVSAFIAEAQKNTLGSHPVAKLVPDSLGQEKIIP